jgi:ribosomal protein S18 acetylase RimI-like enzyme
MITYIDSLKEISSKQLVGFFVGWQNPPSPDTHLQLLKYSYEIILAIDDETQQVVGFITATSDGVLSAYIPFLEVLPTYQGQGIGTELTRRMLEKLKDFYMIDLTCDSELEPFYERFGMRHGIGMMLRNHGKQSGM